MKQWRRWARVAQVVPQPNKRKKERKENSPMNTVQTKDARRFSTRGLVVISAAALVSCCVATAVSAAETRPNIVLIMADDAGC
jgi:hypothetical protein